MTNSVQAIYIITQIFHINYIISGSDPYPSQIASLSNYICCLFVVWPSQTGFTESVPIMNQIMTEQIVPKNM